MALKRVFCSSHWMIWLCEWRFGVRFFQWLGVLVVQGAFQRPDSSSHWMIWSIKRRLDVHFLQPLGVLVA